MATNSETDGTRGTADKDWLEGRRNLSQETFAQVGETSGGTIRGRVRDTLSTVAGLLTRR